MEGVWLASVLRLWGLTFGPTSLKGGEGLEVGWMYVVGRVLRWRRRVAVVVVE